MTALKHAGTVALAVCLLPAASPAAAQDRGLRIVVLEGENSVNIIDRGTAVQTLVEVRGRDGLPVPGATVLFLLGEESTATLNTRLQQVVLTTNALGRAAVAVNPTASGAVELSVNAAFGGETATLTVVQSNYATVAQAMAAGVSTPAAPGTGTGGTGTGAGVGTAAGGGLGTGAIVGIAAAAGAAVGIGVALGGGEDAPPRPSVSTPPAPAAPQLAPGDGRLDVSWSPAPDDGGAAIDDYDVRYRPAGGAWRELPDGAKSIATTASITGLTNGTSYEVQVRAGNSAGDGPWSAGATGTPVAAPSPDRAVLMEFYDATGGPSWTDNTNWGTSAPLAEWFGVSTENGRVTALQLGVNQLTGTIPPSLGSLTRLQYLNLTLNRLAGEIPSSLGGLASLAFLYASQNRLTGAIPPSLGRLANLQELNFRENQLTGPIPATLGNLGSLTTLSLRDNQLTGAVPPELGDLANLRWLALGLNQLTGTIPPSLGNLTNLTNLRLHENDLTGSIPLELGDLANLDFLSLFGNRLSGSIPAGLCRFGDSINPQQDGVFLPCDADGDRAVLMKLYDATNGPSWVDNTNWGSDAPLGQWHGVEADQNGRVTILLLEENGLAGPVPAYLGDLTGLVRLSLYDNELSGPIPPSLGSLSNLELLHLGANGLSGPIPPSLGSLANLVDLRLPENELSGPIPPSLGDLVSLEYLNLNVNELSGPIPPNLGDLANLEALWLLGNGLSGPIPAALCRFKDNINPQQGGVNLPCESSSGAGGASLAVSDARTEEAAGAVVAFAVTLSRAGPGPGPVTVDYATRNGSARAGEDYAAASGTLTFAAGESSKTVEVAVLDDAHDEGEKTLVLALSNASGARLEDAEATGTIHNTDPVPAALLARFGRATAEHVVEHVEERMAKPREPGFRARFAGRDVRPGMERDLALDLLSQLGRSAAIDPTGMPPAGAHGPGVGIGPRGMADRGAGMGCAAFLPGCGASGGVDFAGSVIPGGDLLSSSAFELNRERRGGVLSVWSRSARSSFGGRQGTLSLNGDVRTTMLGADYTRGRLVAGLSLARSQGLGGYDGRHPGRLESWATGLHPWLGYRVNDRVSVWGVTGYGAGAMRLTPDGAAGLESRLSMAMAAAGTRGELMGSRAGGGFALAFKADALWVGTSVDGVDSAAGRLSASNAAATRVRTGIEGSRGFAIGGRMVLTPRVELGVRQDGGDAETGTGVDVGGGLAFTDSSTGLSLDFHLHTLVAHQAEGFTDRGMSLSFSWDPTPSSPQGFAARVAPSWGGDVQGSEALWSGGPLSQLGAYGRPATGRVDAELGYGLPVGRRFVGRPRVGFGSSTYGRAYQLGYRLGALGAEDLDFELDVDAQRRESPMLEGSDLGVLGRASVRW